MSLPTSPVLQKANVLPWRKAESRTTSDEGGRLWATRLKPARQYARRSTSYIVSALTIILLCAILAHPAAAVVDLLYPLDQNSTNNATITFEYYASIPNLTGCTAHINGVDFEDTDVQSNAMNSIQIQAIAQGSYLWNITCSGQETETSASRTFNVDTQAPTLALVSPLEGTQKTILLDIIPNDESSQMLACQATWKDELLDTFTVARNTHYIKNYTGSPGNGTLAVVCMDSAGNGVVQERFLTLIPDFGLQLNLQETQYGLGEPVRLTITTMQGANVSIDICPDQQGFVQCTTALLGSTSFPQTITLPYMNKTGSYLVEGVARFGGQTKVNQTGFTITNSITATILKSQTPKRNSTINLSAVIGGGIAPYHISWTLHDGRTIADATVVNVSYFEPGEFVERLTVTDQAGNSKTVNTTVTINPLYSVMIKTFDNETGAPVKAELDIGDQKGSSGTDGIAYFDLEPGTYQIFVSAAGYQYTVEKRYINGTDLLQIPMGREMNLPKVTLTGPTADSTIGSPAVARFTAEHRASLNCTLFIGTDSWFKASGSLVVNDAQPHDIAVALEDGTHDAKIECSDGSRTGSSQTVRFIVQGVSTAQTAVMAAVPSASEVGLQNTQEQLDAALGALDSYGPKEKEIMALIQFDKNLRGAKKLLQQGIRDVSDLQFRTDLDDAQKEQERKQVIERVNTQLSSTPVALSVTDSKTYVKYVKEDQINDVATALAGLGGLSSDASALRKTLLQDQQKFTVSTKVVQIDYTYLDGSMKSVTAVTRTFTYAPGIESDYQIYELIPKEVAKSARDLTFFAHAEVLKDDPVLRFPMQESFTYLLPRKIDFTRIEDVKTVLARPRAVTTSVTGFAIFSGGDIAGLGMPAAILLGVIILAYLAYYFSLGQQLKFLLYKLGRKEKVHYLRVLINDAVDNLSSNNYEKADLLYKEIRLTYDTLSIPAKNDLYEDIIALVKRMDSYYFNMIMLELDGHLKAGEIESAIRSYEKLTGTFERLDIESQQQLVAAVTGMARRIGLEVAA